MKAFLLVIFVCCYAVAAQEEEKEEEARLDPCTVDGPAARIESIIANETCGTVEGRVQVCEDSFWRNLCDRNVTVQDATVVCRSLNYSMRSELICCRGAGELHSICISILP